MSPQPFYIELIKPSHYDDDGYVIQWRRSLIPSNSLACLHGLALDCAERRVLGTDVDIRINAYDETNSIIPVRAIIRRLAARGTKGLVCFVGVQSNQFPRTMDMARLFRAAGLAVAIGGFHVSGCIAMLKTLPDDLQEALDLGIILFAGEAEDHLGTLLTDIYKGQASPIYNHMQDLPGLEGKPTPILTSEIIHGYKSLTTSFDAGRGCPFQCSFCTIINVQGRKSRFRDPDDVEHIIRSNWALGVTQYFISDDNFARNKNWEAIFDRLIQMREVEGLSELAFIIQVDTLCHKIPNFIEKAARAGCWQVFVGLENINPENLISANKRQNRITEYRTMFQAWRQVGVISYAGYILGFPSDTPASIARDIEIIQRELPVDVLEFFQLTPLPGSADHRDLADHGVTMDDDMNSYDLEHVTTSHAKMSRAEWERAYLAAWDQYYSPEHTETLLRRAVASGINPVFLLNRIVEFYGSITIEKVHPLQAGIFRRKLRRQRRPGMPVENPLLFYPRRLAELVSSFTRFYLYHRRLSRFAGKLAADPRAKNYTDLALTPVEEGAIEERHLDLFEATEAARSEVSKRRRHAEFRTAAGV
jgi:hypothetical protein